MTPAYHYEANSHSLPAARAGMEYLLADRPVRCLLDVGCGTGTWLRAALEAGVQEVMGVDGVPLETALHIPRETRQVADLTQPWSAGRRFDLALCLEVAEHLPASAAAVLIDTLTAHADHVCFSAACPHQPGESHLNCQWPAWWQRLFNERGFACDDSLRRRWWDDPRLEPWYRQNAFTAHRSSDAGSEPRLPSVIHPEMMSLLVTGQEQALFEQHRAQIEQGRLPSSWNLLLPVRASAAKLSRWLRP
jgi:SAM-dependent methyltransferase